MGASNFLTARPTILVEACPCKRVVKRQKRQATVRMNATDQRRRCCTGFSRRIGRAFWPKWKWAAANCPPSCWTSSRLTFVVASPYCPETDRENCGKNSLTSEVAMELVAPIEAPDDVAIQFGSRRVLRHCGQGDSLRLRASLRTTTHRPSGGRQEWMWWRPMLVPCETTEPQ